MKIGTWNMDGKGSPAHIDFLRNEDCDVLLLTEVSESLSIPGYHIAFGEAEMLPRKRWAAIASKQKIIKIESPHAASVIAESAGTTYVASILPWSGSGGDPPWSGTDHPTRMNATLEALAPVLRGHPPLVWGGDWNQSLTGPERAGSLAGRATLVALLDDLEMVVPTAVLSHHIAGLRSIDHVALRGGVEQTKRVAALDETKRLSDHDLYQVVTSDSHR
jgi:hypothetical protein